MNPFNQHPLMQEYVRYETRRQFFKRGASFMGAAALASLSPLSLLANDKSKTAVKTGLLGPHFPAKAKNVIYLHMVGGPPQMDLYDYKPNMGQWFDKDLPESVRMGQRLTTMTSGQARFP